MGNENWLGNMLGGLLKPKQPGISDFTEQVKPEDWPPKNGQNQTLEEKLAAEEPPMPSFDDEPTRPSGPIDPNTGKPI